MATVIVRALVWLCLLAALLGIVGLHAHNKGYAQGKALMQRQLDAEHALQLAAATRASLAYRALEQRITADQQEAHAHAQIQRHQVAASGPGMAAAGQRLQLATAAVAARCGAAPSDPGAAAVGQAPGAPGDLLANVQRRMDEAAADLVRFADAAAISGAECAASYDALTSTAGQ